MRASQKYGPSATGIEKKRIKEFGIMETILGSVKAGLDVSLVPKSSVSGLLETGPSTVITSLDTTVISQRISSGIKIPAEQTYWKSSLKPLENSRVYKNDGKSPFAAELCNKEIFW